MKNPSASNNNSSPLSLRRVAIDTYRENVAYLHRNCALYRAEGFQALAKVDVRANGRHVLATVNVVDDNCIVGPDEVGLSEDAFQHLVVGAFWNTDSIAHESNVVALAALLATALGKNFVLD